MINSFRLSRLAVMDLLAIGRYTQTTWGYDQRNRYLAKLDQCFHMLAKNPDRGQVCDDIRLGYRKYRVDKHLVFYRMGKEGIEIIRILHGSMDLDAYLNE